MRVATFNINKVNKWLPNLRSWLVAEQPDVVCQTSAALLAGSAVLRPS
jgi:exonuclease III